MMDSLGLDRELDSEALLLELESCFDIRFTGAELSECRTVGHLYAIVRGRFTGPAAGVNGCGTAMTLYRLRRSLHEPHRAGASDVLSVAPQAFRIMRHAPKTVAAELDETPSALALDRFSDILGGCAIGAGALALFAAGVENNAFWLGVSTLVAMIGVALLHLEPARRPELGKRLFAPVVTAATPPARPFASKEIAHRDRVLWNVLVEMLADYTRLPKAEIKPETVLLQERQRAL